MPDTSLQPKDFVCPFAEGSLVCPEIMCPTRKAPCNAEKKLFVMMGRELAITKKTCTRCTVFRTAWKNHVGVLGHITYFIKWIRDKELRNPTPQEML